MLAVQIHLGSFYSCADNGTVKRWDLDASEPTMDYVGHYGPVWCIECYGQQMFTGGDDKVHPCVGRELWGLPSSLIPILRYNSQRLHDFYNY